MGIVNEAPNNEALMCADMSVENAFLLALREVKSYYTVSENRMEFRDSEGKVRMVLEKAL